MIDWSWLHLTISTEDIIYFLSFQGRQKLARFNAREFATLIIDILSDAKRRQLGISSPVQTPKDLGEWKLVLN